MSRAVVLSITLSVLAIAPGVCPAQFGLGQSRVISPPRSPQFRPQRLDSEQVAIGRELFARDWLKNGKTPGDGLGPLFNEVSCVACHRLGGIGGAGDNRNNVDMLSVAAPKPDRGGFSTRQRAALRRLHPALNENSLSISLHKHARKLGEEADAEYDAFRDHLMRHERPSRRRKGPAVVFPTVSVETQYRRDSGFVLEFSQRSTPALFGAGLIDDVPDAALIEMAEHQKSLPGISGRVPQTSSGAVGRFGWRGQVGSLHEFVLGACVNELGLQVNKRQPEPDNPLSILAQDEARNFTPGIPFSLGRRKPNPTPDLTEPQTRAMTSFLYSLDAPRPVSGLALQQSKLALEGHKLFEKTGCSDCHVRHMGPARDVYSDLLLHDMGPELADAVSAVPEIDAREVQGTSGYYGGPTIELLVNVTTNIEQEWRTPPLWGLRASAPYLHDGRAATIDEAIRLHAGEGAAASRKYRSLTAANRDKLLAFLNTLDVAGASARNITPDASFGIPVGVPSGGFGGTGFFSTRRINSFGGFSAFAGGSF